MQTENKYDTLPPVEGTDVPDLTNEAGETAEPQGADDAELIRQFRGLTRSQVVPTFAPIPAELQERIDPTRFIESGALTPGKMYKPRVGVRARAFIKDNVPTDVNVHMALTFAHWRDSGRPIFDGDEVVGRSLDVATECTEYFIPDRSGRPYLMLKVTGNRLQLLELERETGRPRKRGEQAIVSIADVFACTHHRIDVRDYIASVGATIRKIASLLKIPGADLQTAKDRTNGAAPSAPTRKEKRARK